MNYITCVTYFPNRILANFGQVLLEFFYPLERLFKENAVQQFISIDMVGVVDGINVYREVTVSGEG